MLNCYSWAVINYKCSKLSIPSRTYNATVIHTKQILGTTFGYPCSWNDKTVVLHDEFLKTVKDGTQFQNCEFILFEYDSSGNIIEVYYKGVWFMVDNGYLSRSNLVLPLKDGLAYQQRLLQRKGWIYEPQDLQMPYINILNLAVFLLISKRHSHLRHSLHGTRVH